MTAGWLPLLCHTSRLTTQRVLQNLICYVVCMLLAPLLGEAASTSGGTLHEIYCLPAKRFVPEVK